MNDLHRFDIQSSEWTLVSVSGEVPRSRYRCTCNLLNDMLILHGGHDGMLLNFVELLFIEIIHRRYYSIIVGTLHLADT